MEYESSDKMVSHPDHYIHGGLETIDVIEAFIEGLPAKEAFLTGQVLKYMSRWNSKNGLQDLEKAQWYLTRLINREKNKALCKQTLSELVDDVMKEDFSKGEHIPLPEEEEQKWGHGTAIYH